ncbi:MAG: SPFH domain-containing protein [Ignavibacteriaceae bacterium]|nr:SPFH domain-containing protein [Ignavibacteriaceae bacterium]
MKSMDMVLSFWWVIVIILILIANKLVLRLFGVVMVPEDSLGVVNKKWVLLGKNKTLPDGAIIALKGEAGLQADTLAPGIHFWLWPWQYEVRLEKFITVERNQIATVEARDGKPLSGGRVLARTVDCTSFQDARAFIENGGERGPQISIIPPGTYRINTALFTVYTEDVVEIPDNMVGVVTTKDGKPLPTGEIAGKEIPGHNMYQDPETFITNGGYKGLQEQVILAGRYFLNPKFATVEQKPMTDVPIANVGVVIAYVGDEGKDVTGDTFKHGNLVSKTQKGVWIEPLDPGKYPINPYTHKVEIVPTANVVLNWATNKTEAHKLDEKLSTITVRSFDGFTFNLDVSQIIHIPRNDAPKVIARFGNMPNLVTQVLEPTIGNYFRNAAQRSDVIDFLKKRSERQSEAKASISEALVDYNVNAVDTLIGDITPPNELMKTLTDRKIAEQEKITYDTQRLAEETRKELQQAKAMADTQANVVSIERTVQINEFAAQAAIKKAEGEAKSKTINAEADATVLKIVGAAEGDKIKAVGTAEADVITLKIKSMQSSNYAAIEVSKNLAGSSNKWVPDIIAGGSSDSGGSIMNVLLGMMVHDKVIKDSVKSDVEKSDES